jgi:hypothetical protein
MPTVSVQIRDQTMQFHAEVLPTAEAIAFWPRILRVAPSYARYRQATSRQIPLVRLVPVTHGGEQAMPTDDDQRVSAGMRSQAG